MSRLRLPALLAPPLAVLACASAHAALPALPPTPLGHESVASADAGASLLVNPAALGVRYPSELWLALTRGSDQRDAWLGTASVGGLGVAWEDAEAGERAWTLGLASGGEALRSGWAVSWREGRSGDRWTDQRAGLLSRPAPWLSLGAAVDHLLEPRVDDVRLRRTWTAGLGLRPFALSRVQAHGWGTRLTLTADLATLEPAQPDDAQMRIGAELEVLPGVLLRAAGERHSFYLGVGLRRACSGYAMRRAYDRRGDFVAHTHAVSVHRGEERTVLTSLPERRVVELRLAGALGDEALGGASLLGGESRTPVAPLHRALERALEDPLTRGVLLDLRGVSNLAQIDELRPRIAALRAAGKPVVAWMEHGGGRGDLLLAAACDRIVASPEAGFGALGLRVERRYYRRLLERWGVRVDRSSIGAYKSAFRNFSVDSTPPADRESIERTLDVLQERFVATVAADRRMPRERLLGLLDGREWPSADLVRAGLIDSAGYREDALAALGGLARLGPRPRVVKTSALAPVQREWTVPARIAVVYAAGAIETGESGNDLLMGPSLGSATLTRQIERAFRDRRARAVVLRIESPGGSSLASDLIHHQLVRMKRETHKPLVVSMGGVAASGGYHIAAPGDRIFAGRFTATGSIGVLFVKPSLEGWYAKHGVRQDAFERGEAMGGWSLGRDWDAPAQASADSAVARSYRGFVALVARQRGLSEAAVDSVAQGRVWYGEDALQHRLVDAIGGLDAALAEARRRAGVPAAERIRLIEYRRPAPGLLQRLVGDVVRETLEREARLPSTEQAWEWDDLEGLW